MEVGRTVCRYWQSGILRMLSVNVHTHLATIQSYPHMSLQYMTPTHAAILVEKFAMHM